MVLPGHRPEHPYPALATSEQMCCDVFGLVFAYQTSNRSLECTITQYITNGNRTVVLSVTGHTAYVRH